MASCSIERSFCQCWMFTIKLYLPSFCHGFQENLKELIKNSQSIWKTLLSTINFIFATYLMNVSMGDLKMESNMVWDEGIYMQDDNFGTKSVKTACFYTCANINRNYFQGEKQKEIMTFRNIKLISRITIQI